MNEDIRGLQNELQDFIREQRESNKRVEDMLEELVEKLAISDGLVLREEQFGKRLERLERVIMLLKTDMPRLTKRVNELDSDFADMKYGGKKD
ncbi:hypothetical protein BK125_17230 [Paenibacillus odorifer]|uniref:Uncharacterized protein n=1 Tax=Paenibacillus odorifer TaxID=189426 RepID=A0ABX3GR01_9BACL|nr:hypothetical protein [Paenibacillus odorifer]OMC76796.1 hypothetical protein BK125_17230 [Paenibacillus odorifer]OMD33141.1 hypothetical protein BSO21_15680 [Paenibacillus odorifer]